MRIKIEILKSIYSLCHVAFMKKGEEGWIVRGKFSLREEVDAAKRFIFLKRHTANLSYTQFKGLSFLRPDIYIEIFSETVNPEDFDKIKTHLWDKLNVFFSHKMEQLLVPTPVA